MSIKIEDSQGRFYRLTKGQIQKVKDAAQKINESRLERLKVKEPEIIRRLIDKLEDPLSLIKK